MSRDCHRRLAGRSRSKRWPDVAAHRRRVGPRLVYCANAWLDRLRLIERESQRSNNLLDYRWPRATLESVLLDGLWLTQPHNYIHQLHRPPLAVRQAIELIQVPQAAWCTTTLAGPSDSPHDGLLGFTLPGPVYLHGDGLCPRRARAGFRDGWAATTYHQRHTFARIALAMRWASRLLAGSLDELVCCEA